eukprot:scaffold1302_cov114-Isochrysis_galbana.AAC.12
MQWAQAVKSDATRAPKRTAACLLRTRTLSLPPLWITHAPGTRFHIRRLAWIPTFYPASACRTGTREGRAGACSSRTGGGGGGGDGYRARANV